MRGVVEAVVENIKRMGRVVGKKSRTYSRKGKQEHLRFSKNRNKTKKVVRKAKKAMLQYMRRNLGQMKGMIRVLRKKRYEVKTKLISMLKTAEKIYFQQLEVYRKKIHRISDHIVSFHRPYVRPIKRGKQGKEVEFGGKGALGSVKYAGKDGSEMRVRCGLLAMNLMTAMKRA